MAGAAPEVAASNAEAALARLMLWPRSASGGGNKLRGQTIELLLMTCACSAAYSAPASPDTGAEAYAKRQTGPVAIPNTAAGRVLRAWLAAFNSGDRVRIEAYCKKYNDPLPPERMTSFARGTGGFDLVDIRASESNRIVFLVRERNTRTTAFGKLTVGTGEPTRVADFFVKRVPPGMTPEDLDIKVDPALLARVLDGIETKLTEFYIYPNVAKAMVAAMRTHQKNGEYDGITDADALVVHLTNDLQAVSHDRHVGVFASARPLPTQDPGEDDPPTDEYRAQELAHNCGFERVEHLPNNIGYVKLNSFGMSAVCGPTATAAMGLVANVDALVFDVRENGGGWPDMVSYVLSYLFVNRTHVIDLWERKNNKTTEFWTTPDLPGKKIISKPVYVLTSKDTFSGGEEFAYDLKTLKRAIIVGETTGGGAHPTEPKRLDDHIGIMVPVQRSISAVTQTDWEGTGVEPDVKVPADKALERALELARVQVEAAKTRPPPQ